MTVIRVENLSKSYRLGVIGTGTFFRDFERWIARMRGKPDPYARIGEADYGNRDGEEVWALRDVSFEVEQGEILGIIGRNGAGKSTLLKILSRVTAPTSGHIKVKGRIASLLEVGTGFHPELTGRENIYLNGAILGMTRDEVRRKFDEIVDFAGVETYIDTPVKRYSSGMYVRLAFAVAAHLEPEILVVDEVLAVGDVQFQKKCLGKMGEVARAGRTVLFVSHNMASVRKLCSRGMLIERGRIATIGLVETIVDRYLSATAAELAPVVTLPPGNIDATGSATTLRFFALNGQPSAQFRLNESWQIVLEFEIVHPVRHMIASVGLLSTEQVSIKTFWSKPQDLMPGSYRVTFVCDIPLAACELEFAVGLSSYERAFYYVSQVGHVSISAIAQDEQPLRASGTGVLLGEQYAEIELIPAINSRSC